MKIDDMLETLKQVMAETTRHICCEAQLKFDLAWKLKEKLGSKAKIYLEYAGKNDNSNMYYDIVIEQEDGYIPIELKFKTKKNKNDDYKNQSAQNLARYDFWYDVERIQNFNKNTGKKFIKGFAVFVTNDTAYPNGKGIGCHYEDFSIYEGRSVCAGAELNWKKMDNPNAKVKKKRNSKIIICNTHVVTWKPVWESENKAKFQALVLEIN